MARREIDLTNRLALMNEYSENVEALKRQNVEAHGCSTVTPHEMVTGARTAARFRPLTLLPFNASTALLLALLPLAGFAAGIPEPSTVFYGKIVNRTSGQEYVLTNGNLSWILIRPDGNQ